MLSVCPSAAWGWLGGWRVSEPGLRDDLKLWEVWELILIPPKFASAFLFTISTFRFWALGANIIQMYRHWTLIPGPQTLGGKWAYTGSLFTMNLLRIHFLAVDIPSYRPHLGIPISWNLNGSLCWHIISIFLLAHINVIFKQSVSLLWVPDFVTFPEYRLRLCYLYLDFVPN